TERCPPTRPSRRARGRPTRCSARATSAGDDRRDDRRAPRSATPDEFSRFCRSITPALMHLGKLTGETLSIDEARIVRLPAWRRIEQALVRALTPWPDALRAAGEELSRLSGVH